MEHSGDNKKRKLGDDGAAVATDAAGGSQKKLVQPRRAAAAFSPSDHQLRCLALYKKGIGHLNSKYGAWAKRMQAKLAHVTNQLISLQSQAYEYLRASGAIKHLYKREPGNVFTCGDNDSSQLESSTLPPGQDAINCDTTSPAMVKKMNGVDFVACGGLHNLCIMQDGSVWSWGANDDGALGRETVDDAQEAQKGRVTGFYPSRFCDIRGDTTNEDNAIVQAAAGKSHSLFLSITGRVYTAGCYNVEGKLYRDKRPPDDRTQDKARNRVVHDDGTETFEVIDEDIWGRHFNPTHVYQLPQGVEAIAAGGYSSAALLDDAETIMTWGVGEEGEMARSATLTDLNENGKYDLVPLFPRKPDKPKGNAEKQSEYEADLDQYQIDSEAYDKQLVVFEETFLKPHPALWAGPKMKRTVLKLACGEFHLLVTARRHGKTESSVYTSGGNQFGQLGHGDTDNRHELTLVKALEGKDIVHVAGGLHHSLFLNITRQEIYSCGRSDYGQLGITDELPAYGSFESLPQRVPFPTTGAPYEFKSIACGDHHNCVVTDCGDLYTWGSGADSGALGHGKEADETRPRKVNVMAKTKGTGVVRMADGGGQHTAMIVSRFAAAAPAAAAPKAAVPRPGDRVVASPFNKKKAQTLGVDPSTVVGTGPDGRITASNVEGAVSGAAPAKKADATPAKKKAQALGVDPNTVVGTGPDGRVTASNVEGAVSGSAPAKKADATPAKRSWTPVPGDVVATPTASTIVGTGESGRVTANDVKITTGRKKPERKRTAPAGPPEVELLEGRVEFTGMQRAVSYNKEATLTTPVVRVGRVIVMNKFNALYQSVKPNGVTVSALLAKAVALTLEKHPIINSSYKDGALTYNKDINIAMDVATDGGLITPTLKNANERSVLELSEKLSDLVHKFKAGTLSPDEYTSGTFTITNFTNLGKFGVTQVEAILPAGMGGILAIGGTEALMVMVPDPHADIVMKKVSRMTVTLTCDHHQISIDDAVSFLKSLADIMGSPETLMR